MKEERIQSFQKSNIERRTFQKVLGNLKAVCHDQKLDNIVIQMLMDVLDKVEDEIYGT